MEGWIDAEVRTRRRRRTPEQAEAEIIAAAEVLLRERPFREMTVDEVMRRTELSRPSFYVYFRDRHDLLLHVLAQAEARLMGLGDRWFKGGRDGPAEIRASMESIVDAWSTHGPVLRALADAATEDERVDEVYAAFVQRFVDATAEHIAREQAAGNALPLDPRPTATALVWMAERYLVHTQRRGSGELPPDAAETLSLIFARVIYGRDA